MLGSNYYQIVYRAVVRLRGIDGVERPAVFFLRSDGNDPVMNFFGNRLTEFRFHYFRRSAIGLFQRENDLLTTVQSRDGGGDLVLHLTDLGPAEDHPAADGFADLNDEKETLVQMFFHAFAHDPRRRIIYDLEIERGEWDCRKTEVQRRRRQFLEAPFTLPEATPVSSIYIRGCSYVWKPMVEVLDAALT